ncbi:MAG: hypothetical protein ACKV2U_32865 [Bryobacteraceae bacterium]
MAGLAIGIAVFWVMRTKAKLMVMDPAATRVTVNGNAMTLDPKKPGRFYMEGLGRERLDVTAYQDAQPLWIVKAVSLPLWSFVKPYELAGTKTDTMKAVEIGESGDISSEYRLSGKPSYTDPAAKLELWYRDLLDSFVAITVRSRHSPGIYLDRNSDGKASPGVDWTFGILAAVPCNHLLVQPPNSPDCSTTLSAATARQEIEKDGIVSVSWKIPKWELSPGGGDSAKFSIGLFESDAVVAYPGSFFAAQYQIRFKPVNPELSKVPATPPPPPPEPKIVYIEKPSTPQPAPPPPPSIDFRAEPLKVMAGDPVTLSWVVLNAKAVSVDPEIGPAASQDTRTIHPKATATYRLTAVNTAGVQTLSSIRVEVIERVAILAFDATPRELKLGAETAFRWNTAGASEVTLELVNKPALSAAKLSLVTTGTGTHTIVAGPREYTRFGDYEYRLTAKGPGGTLQKSIKLRLPLPD